MEIVKRKKYIYQKRNTALVNKDEYFKYHLLLPFDISFHTIKMLVKIILCHEDMTGKRGENVVGISILPF